MQSMHLKDKPIIVRSQSGDVDINVLFLAMFLYDSNKIFLDYGTGKNKKVLRLSEVNMDNDKKPALVCFHALTGNDYISSIFRKSKKACWKLLEQIINYVRTFQFLGGTWELGDVLFRLLEAYTCALFGKKM